MKKKYSGFLFLFPYFFLFTSFLLIPLIYGLGLSAFQWEMLSPAPPRWIGFGNYLEAFQDPYFWKAIWATTYFVVLCVPFSILMSLVLSVGLNALPRGFQSIFRATYFLPTIISISVVGILWRWFYNSEFGLFNAYLAGLGWKIPWLSDTRWAMPSIVLMTLWWTIGGPTVILLAGLQNIPEHYYEAASIDGANSWRKFLHVTLPLLRPVLLFVITMSIIGSFQVFGQTFIVTRGGPEHSTRVLVQYIYDTAFNNYRMGYGAAMSWLLFMVIAFFSLIEFRVLREKK